MSAASKKRPLLTPDVTDEQHKRFADLRRVRSADVVSAVLDPHTLPAVLSHYVRIAATNVELDMRQVNETIAAARLAHQNSAPGLRRHIRTLEVDQCLRERALQDSCTHYNVADESEMNDEERRALAMIRNLKQYLSAFHRLAEHIERPPCTLVDRQYPTNVARALFFYALDSSRAMKTLVTRQQSDERMASHAPLASSVARPFFERLSRATQKFSNLLLDVNGYVAEVSNLFLTGLPELPSHRRNAAAPPPPPQRASDSS